ncbi:hypothetical protein [Paenibacillus sp. 481]|uniref:hypothetical protein n=1 Tax=Paenibacillus sp. 481 TaxID=2835869 RepID=UPI001E5291AD|nr:hypothetical protein [Paenibacillus sp. 481]UHA72171.1 hypothetical protein KIK04_15870 [Paenibacillus sp. 481]
MKIEWAFYQSGSDTEEVFYEHLDKYLYESKYQGHLYCISDECNAMIKFTHRKDGKKFYSTWNGQGDLHDIDCPYYLQYKGEVEKKKILDVIEAASVTDEHIINTIANKSKNLKSKDKVKIPIKKLKTKKTLEGNQANTIAVVDNGEIDDLGSSKIRIFSLDSMHITPDYVGYRKCIFGRIRHVHFHEDDGYAYINLVNEKYPISVYLPQAFYADPTKTTKEALEAFLTTINQELKVKKELIIICVGMIRYKGNNKGINVHVISPLHLLINDRKYYEIITENLISENPYKY